VQLDHRDATQRGVSLTSSQPRLTGTRAPNRVTGSSVDQRGDQGFVVLRVADVPRDRDGVVVAEVTDEGSKAVLAAGAERHPGPPRRPGCGRSPLRFPHLLR
jgi:hypothetical protein